MTKPRQTVVHVPIERLTAHPSNIRDDLGGLEELARSIAEHGVLQPLTATEDPDHDGHLLLLAGHRRLGAARALGWAKVPAIIRRDLLPDEELLAMIVENGQRTDLDPIEEAHAYRRLVDMGLSKGDVARRVGRHVSTIAGRLALLSLPLAEQEEIRAGELPLVHVKNRAAAERQQERLRAGGRGRGRPVGVKTKPYFGETHPLAKTVRATCDHRGRPKVGGIGCGECWESTIRTDEAQPLRDQEAS